MLMTNVYNVKLPVCTVLDVHPLELTCADDASLHAVALLACAAASFMQLHYLLVLLQVSLSALRWSWTGSSLPEAMLRKDSLASCSVRAFSSVPLSPSSHCCFKVYIDHGNAVKGTARGSCHTQVDLHCVCTLTEYQ